MKAAIMYSAGDVRIEDVPDAVLKNATDALVRITRACICGSDLWPYNLMKPSDTGVPMGHEAIGIVEAVGADVRRIKRGNFVVMRFAYSDGSCAFCHEGLHTSCPQGGFFGSVEVPGAQAEAVRVPQADGTLYPLPVADDALLPSLLTLSDVMGTGHHAAVTARPFPTRSGLRAFRKCRRGWSSKSGRLTVCLTSYAATVDHRSQRMGGRGSGA